MSIKGIQKMAKNGEFSKMLLKDENFKREIKDILQNEYSVKITDKQLSGVVKNCEYALGSGRTLSDGELELVFRW